ncbi:MAG TPA: hypothetical protein VHH91_05815 [Vicinamibacterales bacterium]|jgi:hypothetical protein|nr:hypothetical protein [Vicinamibacterales bacterium]
MDDRHNDEPGREHHSRRAVPDNAPDPVETRDPASRPTPARRRVWLFAVPAVAFLILGIVWMARTEGRHGGAQRAPSQVTGTSGARANDPEGLGRGDESSLNPRAEGPSVIGDLGLLSAKENYVGRAVEIPAIPVMGTPGPRTLWVGRPLNRTLVLLDRNVQRPGEVKGGEQVRVSGQLERRPDKDAIDRAGLHDDDREALEGVEVFIRASTVERPGSKSPTRQ